MASDDFEHLPTLADTGSAAGEAGPPPPLADSAAGALFQAAAPPRAARHAWQPPAVEDLQRGLPQYRIDALIGRGGMGAVYRGWQRRLERPVAIKILPAEIHQVDPAFAERFKREAKAMARLSHPGIVAVHDGGETADGVLYFVMDFIEGTDVQQMIAQRGKLPPHEALSITVKVLDALAYAHGKGIIHRDIKPSNVMVDAEGHVKVADFGLAKITTAETGLLTASDVTMGTPAFMAPETLSGAAKVDHRADLYAVGVMLYQMLTGLLPRGSFPVPSRAVAGLDKRLDGVITRALQPQRDARFSSASELRNAIAPVLTRTLARHTAATGGTQPSWKRPARFVAPAIAATAVVLAVAGWFVWTDPPAGGASSAAPSRQWTKVLTTLEEFPEEWRRGDDPATIENGWLVRKTGKLNWRRPAGSNHGIRATFRRSGREGRLHVRSQRKPSMISQYDASVRIPGLRHFERVPEESVRMLAMAQRWQRIGVGETYTLELFAIGHRLFARAAGELLSAPVPILEAGDVALYCDGEPVRDIEIIDLNGLPEAEALRLAGIAEPAVARIWRDALAEPPLKDVIANAEKTSEGALLPPANHWRFPQQSLRAAALRIRATVTSRGFPHLCLFLDRDDGAHYRVRIHGDAEQCMLSYVPKPGADQTLANKPVTFAEGQPYDMAFIRAGGRLLVTLNGLTLLEADDPVDSPGRFGIDCVKDARVRILKAEYIDLDGLPRDEALRLGGANAGTAAVSPAGRLAVADSFTRNPAGQNQPSSKLLVWRLPK